MKLITAPWERLGATLPSLKGKCALGVSHEKIRSCVLSFLLSMAPASAPSSLLSVSLVGLVGATLPATALSAPADHGTPRDLDKKRWDKIAVELKHQLHNKLLEMRKAQAIALGRLIAEEAQAGRLRSGDNPKKNKSVKTLLKKQKYAQAQLVLVFEEKMRQAVLKSAFKSNPNMKRVIDEMLEGDFNSDIEKEFKKVVKKVPIIRVAAIASAFFSGGIDGVVSAIKVSFKEIATDLISPAY